MHVCIKDIDVLCVIQAFMHVYSLGVQANSVYIWSLDYADSVKFNLAMFMSKAYISKVILMYGRFPDHHCGIIMSKGTHSKSIVICGDYHCGCSMHGDIVKFH